MENLPIYISFVFIITTLLAVWFFWKAAHYSPRVILVIVGWLIIQTAISLTGFYTVTSTVPPRFVLLVVPPVLLIAGLFFTAKGRNFLRGLNPATLTLLHVVRLPVELVLYWLFLHKTVPGIMTFEGRNFDIFSGLTAPLIYYFGFVKKQLPWKVILAWNIICFCLLVNIVASAVLSAPFPFQQLAFGQPNVAVLYFPFTLLPACVVPLVLLTHLTSFQASRFFGIDFLLKENGASR